MTVLRISTDQAELDVARIHRFLCGEAAWSRGISRSTVERAIAGSLCCGGDVEGAGQVAFARVVNDGAAFGDLADVLVLSAHRRRGHGRRVMDAVMVHPQLQGLRRLLLATSDAHGLYGPYGFAAQARPPSLMERLRSDLYLAAGAAH
ncbi:GNAT family N-acetyltransferase [Xanthomonas theicola]|uniref:GNAT family N-acetyltransferase n=1 Tax=Xanthomonas theicola TaxID=56464 RepID=A0A2S6ZD23_9XANT|nr:GNAT family N-acetyltransferase [Xanthomonas theicola]PPT89202.1 GNAT family N-acetyltransferase [Xanthomonas theicola]QNH25369.1 GNAT family N-acetyltransferase [Xanthomonas theicola]